MLRDDGIGSLAPPVDVAGAIARLRAGPPHIARASPGVIDPDASVASDPSRPLVLYELNDPLLVLRVTKAAGPALRLDW